MAGHDKPVAASSSPKAAPDKAPGGGARPVVHDRDKSRSQESDAAREAPSDPGAVDRGLLVSSIGYGSLVGVALDAEAGEAAPDDRATEVRATPHRQASPEESEPAFAGSLETSRVPPLSESLPHEPPIEPALDAAHPQQSDASAAGGRNQATLVQAGSSARGGGASTVAGVALPLDEQPPVQQAPGGGSIARRGGQATGEADLQIDPGSGQSKPSFALDSDQIAENSPNGTLVGTLAPSGGGASAPLTYQLTDDAGGRFTIDNSGHVIVADSSLLDFEAAASHGITVLVTDADGRSYVESLTIAVTDVVETTSGTAGNDVLTGDIGADALLGLAGLDSLYGGAGADELDGGKGADKLVGGIDDDSLDGSSGDDRLYGGDGDDSLFGGLATGSGKDTEVGGDDSLYGEGGDDVLDGGDGDDLLDGGAGNDILAGDLGDDELLGGDGDDNLSGGDGADELTGGAGNDTASYTDSGAAVTLDLAAGTGIGGDAQGDVLSGIENVVGSAHADTLLGDAVDNTLEGGAGDDSLFGGAGDDVLKGGLGADELTGGDGSDLFIAMEGGGDDQVFGGAGGGWTDTIQLQNAVGGEPSAGWVINLDTGVILDSQPDHLVLSDDAAGVITLQDGTDITFEGIERVEW